MASKATYVFLDLGTTGDITNIPKLKITELCMVAVRQDRLLAPCYPLADSPPVPRVQLKLTLCFNPGGKLSYKAKPGGGFTDDDLEHERTFDECFDLIDNFLNTLTGPVYLVAHNGFNFDFPILKTHLKGKSFSKDILCVDTYFGFYDLLNARNTVPRDDIVHSMANLSLGNPSDVTRKRISDIRQENAERIKSPPWGEWKNKPKTKYTLTTVYKRVMLTEPEDAHKADVDCQLMLRIAVKLAKEFVAWADVNHSSFADHVEPRTPKGKHITTRVSGVQKMETEQKLGTSDSKKVWDAESGVSKDKEAGTGKCKKEQDLKPMVSESRKFVDVESKPVEPITPMRKKERDTGRTSRNILSNLKHEMDMKPKASDNMVDKNAKTPKGNNDSGVDPIASESRMVGYAGAKVSKTKGADKNLGPLNTKKTLAWTP